ncbi:MAG: hypothetical protein ACI4U4_03870 [Bacilli bacterium]
MIYYKIVNNNGANYIIKNEVTFDKEKLEKLRLKLLNTCSEIVFHKYKTTNPYSIVENEIIRDFKCKEIGIRHGKGYEPDLPEYQVEYYEYRPPIEVLLLKEIIAGDNNSLVYLLDRLNNVNEDIIKISNPKVEELNKLNKEIEVELKNSNISLEETANKLLNINKKKKSLEEQITLNKNQKPIELYYKEIKSLFIYIPTDMLPLEDLNKVLTFFSYEKDNEKELNKNIHRILKKNDK